MDDGFVTVVEQQHHDLQQVARPIRAQPQLATWAVLVLVPQRVGDQEPARSVDDVLVGDAVLARYELMLLRPASTRLPKCFTFPQLKW